LPNFHKSELKQLYATNNTYRYCDVSKLSPMMMQKQLRGSKPRQCLCVTFQQGRIKDQIGPGFLLEKFLDFSPKISVSLKKASLFTWGLWLQPGLPP